MLNIAIADNYQSCINHVDDIYISCFVVDMIAV